MTAEEQAVYNSFLGTSYRYPYEGADETYIFNTDGTLIMKKDNGETTTCGHWWIKRSGSKYLFYPRTYVVFYVEGSPQGGAWNSCGMSGQDVDDEDGDGIYDLGSWKRM